MAASAGTEAIYCKQGELGRRAWNFALYTVPAYIWAIARGKLIGHLELEWRKRFFVTSLLPLLLTVPGFSLSACSCSSK